MKKRKPPVLLVSLLVLLLSGVVIYSLYDMNSGKTVVAPPIDANANQGAPNADDVANSVKSSKSGTGKVAVMPAPPSTDGSLIKNSPRGGDAPQIKPRRNPESISSQWYTPQSAK